MVVGGRMRGRSRAVVRRRRAGSAAPTSPVLRRRRRQPHALGSSAGVCGHGAAGRAGGTAPAARPQTPPFHIGMGKAAEIASASNGGAYPGDRGARDAGAVRRRGGAARPAAQHTAARRRIWARRSFTVTSPLSASRADNEQLPASAKQVRERRARVGGRGGGGSAWRAGRRRRRRRGDGGGQKGRTATEGDAVVGAHGYTAAAPVPSSAGAAPVCHGAAAHSAVAAARRVTEPRAPHHAYIPLSGR